MAIILNSGTIQTITEGSSELLHIPNNYTLPYVPVFSAARDAGHILGTAGRVIFDNVYVNNGNDYSNTTGLYTAPIDGIYWFEVWTMDENSNTQYVNDYLRLVRNSNYSSGNGDELRIYTSSETTDRRHRSGGMIHKMSAGDTMEVYNSTAHIYATSAYYNRFEGYLMQF